MDAIGDLQHSRGGPLPLEGSLGRTSKGDIDEIQRSSTAFGEAADASFVSFLDCASSRMPVAPLKVTSSLNEEAKFRMSTA